MSALEFCVLASVIHCIYDTHGGTLKSHNHMKITTTIDIPEETALEAKYILLAHRNASERRLLSSFYRACLLAGRLAGIVSGALHGSSFAS